MYSQEMLEYLLILINSYLESAITPNVVHGPAFATVLKVDGIYECARETWNLIINT